MKDPIETNTEDEENQNAIYTNLEIKEVWKSGSRNGLPSLLSSHGFEQRVGGDDNLLLVMYLNVAFTYMGSFLCS